MAPNFQDQQQRSVRNKLIEAAHNVLEGNIEDGVKRLHRRSDRATAKPQSGHSLQSDAAYHREPESYKLHEATGFLNFPYEKDFKAAPVTKCDPPVKIDGYKYNIVTGNLMKL